MIQFLHPNAALPATRILIKRCLLGLLPWLALTACERDMADQPKYEPLEAAAPFPNAQAARHPVEGTVARNAAIEPAPDHSPQPLIEAVLNRGRERYDIYCSPCHGRVGDGRGMIPERGFPSPPSYHTDRLRQAPDRHFYDVITLGYGVMFSYAGRVAPEDRWAIVAYIRALQLSQNATLRDVQEAGLADRLGGQP
jgi:mono/diheme cytochrome c family protein